MLATLREEFVAAASKAPAAPSSFDTDPFVLEQRRMGRERRQREEERRAKVEDYVRRHLVVKDRLVSTVRVTLPVQYGVAPACVVDLPVPLDTTIEGGWKPRPSRRLWQTPYKELVAHAVFALREGCADADAPLAQVSAHHSMHQPDIDAASNSLQRMFMYITYAEAMRRGGGQRVMAPLATTTKTEKTHKERVYDEQQTLSLVLQRLRGVAYGFPGAAHPDAQTAMLAAYGSARLFAPQRTSMVSLLAMRIACVLRAMVPHLIPTAPHAAGAELIASSAQEAFEARSPQLYEMMRRNAASMTQKR